MGAKITEGTSLETTNMNDKYRNMYRRTGWIFCSLLLAAGLVLAGCDSPPKIAVLEPDAVILAFGDSLTYGTGASRDQSYPAQLERSLKRRVVNAGVPGEVSAAGLSRLPELLAQHRPSLVILCHGGNDFLHRNGTDNVRENLRQMVSLIKGSGMDVILVSVPQLGFGLSPSPLYAEIAEEFEIPLEEEILSDILAEPSLKSDHIHPNAEGYAVIAEAFARLIDKTQAH
jgi:lysophospholipase L1-like esterase